MTDRSRDLNVAVLAEVFNPDWPSLPVVGFNYATALAKFANVTVFTQIRNRNNIDKIGNLGFNIEYIDTEYIAKPMITLSVWLRRGYEVAWTIEVMTSYLPYIEFERKAIRRIEKRSPQFDIVHRITPMSPTLPSYAAARCSSPFILGPLNGNLPWPREFLEEKKREREVLDRIKSIYKYLPFYRSTYRSAAAIIAAFPHTIGSIDKRFAEKTIDMPEIGYDESIFYPVKRKHAERLTFLYVGRLVPYKLAEVAILTFAEHLDLRRHRLQIAGRGPEEGRLRQLVANNGLDECVEFLGGLSQRQVADAMRRADVFFFPSIRELGAGVVIEAMACGLPCVVADYGAPGALVDETRGRKVRIADKRQMIRDFAAAALDLVNNPLLIDTMAVASQRYARNFFTWEKKARVTLEIYEWALRSGARKPTFQYR